MSAATIKETRNLVLPLETVVQALLHFERTSHGPLARGAIVQAELVSDPDSGVSLDVAVRMDGGDEIEWRHFDFSQIAAAIIGYCRASRIPLPISGVKSLALTHEGLAFRIENTVNIVSRPEVRADLAGRSLRYAKGYEPHACQPSTQNETCV